MCALPNHVFNRTRRYGPSTWRSSVAAGRVDLVLLGVMVAIAARIGVSLSV